MTKTLEINVETPEGFKCVTVKNVNSIMCFGAVMIWFNDDNVHINVGMEANENTSIEFEERPNIKALDVTIKHDFQEVKVNSS